MRALSVAAPTASCTSTTEPSSAPMTVTRPDKTLRMLIPAGRSVASDTSRARIRARTLSPTAASRWGTMSRSAVEGERRQLIARVMCRDLGFDQRSGLVATGGGSEIETSHHVVHVADGEALPVGQDHHGVGEPRDFRDRVADVDDRDVELVAQPFDVVEDLGLARNVERRQRLVHEQDARLCEQGAADRHPLLLPARERPGLAVQQRAQAEELDDARLLDEAIV